jgi:hypothetical protein
MGIILNYLNENGEVFCPEYMIEELYEQFSQEKHNCSWMHVILTALRDIMLPEFDKWLEHTYIYKNIGGLVMENKKVVEINGQRFEVDMATARVVDEYKVGDNVKVLQKDYSGYKALPGVITEFVNFKNMPTIVIAVFKEDYNGISIDFIYYNSASTEDLEICPCCEHELKLNKERAVDKFNVKIAEYRSKIDELEAKRDYFIKYFDKHFEV